jgi:hypothetical protein
MKKILLYFKIALLLVTTSSTAQTYYSHYLDGTSEWRYYGAGPTLINAYSFTYRTIFFDGTEDYGGYTYRRERFFTVNKYYDFWTNEYLFQEEYYPTIYNLVREDAQGRFYRRGYTDYTVEEMYQDNAPIQSSQVGDNFPSLPNFNFGACAIVTIQQLGIAGLNIKKLMGTNGPYGGLVEGVGPLGQACNGGANSLVCYTKQGESLIFEPGTDCSIFPLPVRLSNLTFHKNSIKIYPNPTNGIVTIESNEVIEKIELWDMLGRKFLTQNSIKLDLSSFSNGTYLLIIKTDKQQQTQRIIKN